MCEGVRPNKMLEMTPKKGCSKTNQNTRNSFFGLPNTDSSHGARTWCTCSSWRRCRPWRLRLWCSCMLRACALAHVSRVLVRLRAAIAPTICGVAEWEINRAFACCEILRTRARAHVCRVLVRLCAEIAPTIWSIARRVILRAHARHRGFVCLGASPRANCVRVVIRLRAHIAKSIRIIAERELLRAHAQRRSFVCLCASPRADCPRVVIRFRAHIAKPIIIVAKRELLRAHACLSCCRRWSRRWRCTTSDFRRTIAHIHLAFRTTSILRTRAAPYLPSSRARVNAVIGIRDRTCRIRIRLHCQYQRTRSTTRNCQTFLNRRRHLVTTERQRHPIVRRRPFDRQQASIPCDARLLIIRRYDVICRINEPDVQIRLRHK